MTRKAGHSTLGKAKASKNDEFYTQLCDIERELQYYESHFQGKVVFCNCDDFSISNFARYFIANFARLGLKKLICSCYQPLGHGSFIEFSGEGELNNIEVKAFNGDGDFRSSECIELLKQADIVVTNPPFSLFREFIAQLNHYNKSFLLISNINAITYKEIFNLIQQNKLWLGINLGRGISGFIVPPHYQLYGQETKINDQGERIVATNNCMWLTNLDNFQRHELLALTKLYKGYEDDYPKYDNCDAINVNRTKDIPADYFGLMGVPITFLHKFNPAQFEIVRFRKGDDNKDLTINGKPTYFRILIRPVVH